MKLNLSEANISKLRNGHTIQLKPSQIGSGIDYHLPSKVQKNLEKSYKLGKGVRLSIPQDYMEGSGIFGKKFDKKLKKLGIKKAVFKGAKALQPMVDELLDQGVETLKSNPITAPYVPVALAVKNGVQRYIESPTQYQSKAGLKSLAKKSVVDTYKDLTSEEPTTGGRINKYLPTKLLSKSGGSIRTNSAKVYSDSKNVLRPDQAGFNVASSVVRPNNASFGGSLSGGCSCGGCKCGAGFRNFSGKGIKN